MTQQFTDIFKTKQSNANPFADLHEKSQQHRKAHGCGAYSYTEGPLLSVLAAAIAPRRIIEVGTALGYSAICMADGAPTAQIDTVEQDPIHIELANEHFATYGVADRVTAHQGDADEVLPSFGAGEYDLAFFDGFAPTRSILTKIHRLLRPGGTLICANLTLGGDGEEVLRNPDVWRGYSLGETAIAVKLSLKGENC